MESRDQLWSLDINYGNFGHHLDIIWNLDIDLDINNEVYGHKLWTSIINIEIIGSLDHLDIIWTSFGHHLELWTSIINIEIIEIIELDIVWTSFGLYLEFGHQFGYQ